MNAFFSEHRLMHFRAPEVPHESPEPAPERKPEQMSHAPIALTEARFRMIAEQTLGQADSLADPQQREAMRQQTADIQRKTGEEIQNVAADVQRDVLEEAA